MARPSAPPPPPDLSPTPEPSHRADPGMIEDPTSPLTPAELAILEDGTRELALARSSALAPVETPVPPAAAATPDPLPLPTGESPLPQVGGELTTLRHSWQELGERMALLQSRLASREAAARRELTRLEEERSQTESRVRGLEEDLEQERSSRQRSEESLRQVQEGLRAREQELQTERSSREQVEGLLEHARADGAESARRIQQVSGELASVVEERGRLQQAQAVLGQRRGAEERQLLKAAKMLREAHSELQQRDENLRVLEAKLEGTEHELGAARARAETGEMESSRRIAEVSSQLRSERDQRADIEHRLAESSARVAALEKEVAALRSAPPPGPEKTVRALPPSAGPVPCVPVGFLGPRSPSVVKEAYFALGKGEALERLLETTLRRWGSLPYPMVPTGGPNEPFSIVLRGDPQGRSIRVLHSGAFLLRLGEQELSEVGELPTLVRRRSTGSPVRATSLASRSWRSSPEARSAPPKKAPEGGAAALVRP
ncbi:MAG: hypothetical protein KGJ23_01520 [Euryarchaeota archaeon]|nr:hypothetical protein [Euryarchaeota archaeon]MDE2043570.1 hypothetical protein [Thermoplasmata archaeon]